MSEIEDKLKLCPFCGGKASLKNIGNEWTKKRSVIIKCKSCRVQMTNSALIHDMEWLESVSIKDWNMRT